jgi:hypothetical protein
VSGDELANSQLEEVLALPWQEVERWGNRDGAVAEHGTTFRVRTRVFWDMEPWESDLHVTVRVYAKRGWRRWRPFRARALRELDASAQKPIV